MHPGVFAARSRSRRRSSWGAAGTVVTYAEGAGAGAGALADRLASYCREHPAGFKCPRSYEFTTGELRTPVSNLSACLPGARTWSDSTPKTARRRLHGAVTFFS